MGQFGGVSVEKLPCSVLSLNQPFESINCNVCNVCMFVWHPHSYWKAQNAEFLKVPDRSPSKVWGSQNYPKNVSIFNFLIATNVRNSWLLILIIHHLLLCTNQDNNWYNSEPRRLGVLVLCLWTTEESSLLVLVQF